MIPSCLTTFLQQLRDRWECFMHGALVEEDVADALYADNVDLERENETLRQALSEAIHTAAVAEENAARCERDLFDVLFLRGAMREHPSFGGDQ